MTNPIAGRITLNMVAGIVVTLVTVLMAIAWMAVRQNEQAAAGARTMVEGGVEAMQTRIKGLANDYAWWEEAYEAYLRGDAEWIEANLGTGITETNIADVLAVVSPAGEIAYSWGHEGDPALGDVLTPAAIAQLRDLIRSAPVENSAARAAYLATSGEPLLVGVTRLAPVSRAAEVDPATLPLIVMGSYLRPDSLQKLGATFLVDDLHLDRSGSPEAAAFPAIIDLFGRTIAHLVWTQPTPGTEVLRNIFLPVSGALLLFCFIAAMTAVNARRLALAQGASERQAVVAARTDSLTGLANRFGFNEFIESPAFSAACHRGEAAIVYLDVNGFKSVNDSIGHQGGDELVSRLAERLGMILPAEARFARIGGDEFALALVGRSAPQAVAGVASAMVHALDQPFSIGGFQFQVTAAVGYAVAEGVDSTAAELLRRADLAMYQAKAAAERDAISYHAGMETGALQKKRLEAALREAIEREELSLVYQPIVRAADLQVTHVEALLRWNSPTLGFVSPGEFVPVAEETGLIHELGRFVVRRACTDLADWPGLKVSVNVSPAQLRDPNFANDLVAITRRHGSAPGRFTLELTEGLLVRNPTIAKRKLARLKALGFSLSLDDFGTGFSSIGYLRQFPFDALKIDRSFVADLGANPTANALIQSMVALGDAMDIEVVAEGVETGEQLRLLRLLRCEYLQGYHIAKPLKVADLGALFERLGGERRLILEGGSGDGQDRVFSLAKL
ncbi:putative bifunctional diguanylate cyclase/phosphodiesterase [Prosthecomicrobium pneumaticum]|uniref:Diguanylate cyclase (GGDEF)-like protein n=1 Tax=Prosthecomicrobium pneumaticum TaxID=81895 RepID=A0A7W9L384_9HYPH|nr:EAL domain-containing protein [Prosthecomicrobium pneumaticum]MBB5754298.1 diguanylate cyclase (GGDEF)-like protein [Prosthecomicrobium pneumaticum]